MIKYLEGDIFTSPAQVIVNTVNTVGVMGKGIALSFKKAYPEMYKAYRNACEDNTFQMGNLMLWREIDHWILLFPTKENWRNPSKLEYIEQGLKKFVENYMKMSINSIAFPRLGCGNGGLNWQEVKPLMEMYLKPLPIDVYIYIGEYNDGLEEHKNPVKTLKWMREQAKDMSFYGVVDDIKYNSSLAPYEFAYNNEKIEARYVDKQLVFTKNGEDIFIVDESSLYEIWDRIRSNSIIILPEVASEKMVIALLESLGYLFKVKIIKGEEGFEGYQLNSGAGRNFAAKGD